MKAERFFMQAVPDMVQRNLNGFVGLRGDVTFIVRGRGSWTVHLGNIDEPVSVGISAESALRLIISPTSFEELVEGTLDIAKAVENRKVAFKGDISLLEKLGFLLSTGSSPLATRVAQGR